MKKTIITAILCLGLTGPCFAQNNLDGMRILTVTALMQYGQKLYDRGDMSGASAVFQHVLEYDQHQSKALGYLKKMGQEPVSITNISAASAAVSPKAWMSVVRIPLTPAVTPIDIEDTQALKAAIDAKKHSIEKLKAQIKDLQANMAAPMAVN